MLIPKTYYRVGDKAAFKSESFAVVEAEGQMANAKQITTVRVYKCVRSQHDESSMVNAKEDSLEWRIDDVIEPTPSLAVTWKV